MNNRPVAGHTGSTQSPLQCHYNIILIITPDFVSILVLFSFGSMNTCGREFPLNTGGMPVGDKRSANLPLSFERLQFASIKATRLESQIENPSPS